MSDIYIYIYTFDVSCVMKHIVLPVPLRMVELEADGSVCS